jgi:hypothetical protein
MAPYRRWQVEIKKFAPIQHFMAMFYYLMCGKIEVNLI